MKTQTGVHAHRAADRRRDHRHHRRHRDPEPAARARLRQRSRRRSATPGPSSRREAAYHSANSGFYGNTHLSRCRRRAASRLRRADLPGQRRSPRPPPCTSRATPAAGSRRRRADRNVPVGGVDALLLPGHAGRRPARPACAGSAATRSGIVQTNAGTALLHRRRASTRRLPGPEVGAPLVGAPPRTCAGGASRGTIAP